MTMNVNCLIFDDFEILDLFGPVEVLEKIEEYSIEYFSMHGGTVSGRHNARIMTKKIGETTPGGILIVPGGVGTRVLIDDALFIEKLKQTAEESTWCLTVCTGSALLAKTGLLDNRGATSNKIAFEWVRSKGKNVHWKDKARWVVDKKYYTSSGISAGIDMALGFVWDRFGKKKADEIAKIMEYEWHDDKNADPFAS
jgi:transcriptional regulator GlxA family with amidase domain